MRKDLIIRAVCGFAAGFISMLLISDIALTKTATPATWLALYITPLMLSRAIREDRWTTVHIAAA